MSAAGDPYAGEGCSVRFVRDVATAAAAAAFLGSLRLRHLFELMAPRLIWVSRFRDSLVCRSGVNSSTNYAVLSPHLLQSASRRCFERRRSSKHLGGPAVVVGCKGGGRRLVERDFAGVPSSRGKKCSVSCFGAAHRHAHPPSLLHPSQWLARRGNTSIRQPWAGGAPPDLPRAPSPT